MITIKSGHLIYKGNHGVQALKNINLEIEKEDWITILGPSGSGKTTLLNVLGGLEQLTEGTIEESGRNLQALSEAALQEYRRNTVGFIYQDYRLFKQYTVLENVMMPLWPYRPREELKKEAELVLEQLKMMHRKDHLPDELSGGEKQRVAIARALLNKPKLLLCDEPTGNLDVENRENIMEVLKSLHREGLTIVLVTHDTELAIHGTRVLHMRDGLLEERVLV